jgi:uncharacterized OB-fold protein
MAKRYRTLEAEVRLPYQLAYGETWARFFDGMKEEKILGTKCPKCNRVLVPARTFCPRCFVDSDQWIECAQEGKLVSWVLINYTFFDQLIKPPFITGMIRLDGTDVEFMHFVGGFDLNNLEEVKNRVQTGIRVKAVWEKERSGSILDLKYFAPC